MSVRVVNPALVHIVLRAQSEVAHLLLRLATVVQRRSPAGEETPAMHASLIHQARLLALLLYAICVCARGEDSAQAPAIALTVLGTDPATDAQLHYQEPFYLRFQVESHAPVRVLAEAYYQGEEVPVATIKERKLLSGGGTDATLIFHWPEQPTPVDEIRLVVTRIGQRQPAKTVSVPVNLTWGTEPAASPRPVPQWVREFEAQRERERALDPEYRAYRKRSSATGRGWIVMCLIGLVGFVVAGGVWAARWRRTTRPDEAD
jgi:hypothetical protein